MDKKTALPSHWEIKKMTEVVTWGSGGTPKATEKSYYENGTIPWLIIGDLNDGIVNSSLSKITELGLKNSSAKMIPVGTLLVAMYGSIGKLGITGIECCTNQAIAFAKELHGVTTKYMFYYMSMIKPKLISMGKGGTQKNISQSVLKSLDVVVPPIPEQERIVSKIEELFSKLDASVTELQTAKDKLKVYRQAVLKEALEGDYHCVRLKEIATAFSGYAFKSKKYSSNGRYVVVKIGNVKPFRFDFSRDLTKTSEIDDNILNKYLLKKGDCLITMTGSRGKRDYGYVAMVEDQDNYLLNQRVSALRFDDSVALPKFYEYVLSSPQYRNQFFSYETGNVGQGNVGIKALTEPKVICPTLKTQEAIIQSIEFRLSLCDSIEQTIDTSLQQAEALRQSILKQAFEGDLKI